ncbi:MAG: GSCFA domain-containing protein [Hansschlegelia sp.]
MAAAAPGGVASPYEDLPSRAFWRTGVAEQSPLRPVDLYRKKFALTAENQIATAGSCFAQHIARRLKDAGYTVIDREPPPIYFPKAAAKTYGYDLYSARYGNIYTTRQLLQLGREAFGAFSPAEPVWERDGRFYDAQRPSVEPGGLSSPEEVLAHRKSHLDHVAQMLKQMDLLIFTLGLTETWEHRASGTVYPTAPGVIAGAFDPARFAFRNLAHAEVIADFIAFRALAQASNPGLRFLLTVSPVPLTATAGGEHVLAATTYSKSVLRAAAGELAQRFDDVDYFPSYEIVSTHPSRGVFFEPNMRSVAEAGVDVVMEAFFAEHAVLTQPPARAKAGRQAERKDRRARRRETKEDLVCEEVLLEAFAR